MTAAAVALGALVGVSGCASERHASTPIGWSRDEITAIAPYPPTEPGGLMAWTAASPGPISYEMASRRNAALLPTPPAPITATSAWPGPSIPNEQRRVPTIYSRWGRSF